MIRIFPLDQINDLGLTEKGILKELEPYSEKIDLSGMIGPFELFSSGRMAIRSIIEYEQLNRDDEVYITTSCDTSYVPTCVSATIFNYCKISRVISDRTKAIFVIHTFCFPHPDIIELRRIANDRNIPLIEDCISAFDSFDNNNIRLGSIGDYSLYSLPKIIPIEYGGILTSKSNAIKGIDDKYLEKKLASWTPFLNRLKIKKRDNYFALKDRINSYIYKEDKYVNPFMFGFYSIDSQLIHVKFCSVVEFGTTHVKNEVHIPVNPFIDYLSEKKDLITFLSNSK